MLSASLRTSRRLLRSKPNLTTRTSRTTRLPARATPRSWYTTEKILKHRLNQSLSSLAPSTTAATAATRLPATLYDASQERENCGVGMVASLKSIASRKVVMDANEMLVRMSHRGGVGCCPASGDGAGEFSVWMFGRSFSA